MAWSLGKISLAIVLSLVKIGPSARIIGYQLLIIPSDKASVDFIVTAPAAYEVIGNGVKIEESYLNTKQKLTHWREEVDIPTKVIVIGAARFAIHLEGNVSGIPVESWVYPQNRLEGFHDYAGALNILEYFHNHIGPYPYKKLANVQTRCDPEEWKTRAAFFTSKTP